VCDWLVTVKLRGSLVVSVTCRKRQKIKWKTCKERTTTIKTTIIKIKITITIIRLLENIDTDNRRKKMGIIFCFYKNVFHK
jgi:hypothetical protein